MFMTAINLVFLAIQRPGAKMYMPENKNAKDKIWM
jgi:hypothetical protein